jgi:ribosomal protein L29
MHKVTIKELKTKLLNFRLSMSAGNDVDRKTGKALKKEISLFLTKVNSIKK